MLITIANARGLKRFPGTPFLLFSVFIMAVFFLGGSSWADEPCLVYLRASAFLVTAFGIWTLSGRAIREHWQVVSICCAALFLTISHLLPLPFDFWTLIPSRHIISQIDMAAGLGQISRPLSIAPFATLNALLALSVPVALIVVMVQFDSQDHRLALYFVLVLCLVSAMAGALQATGVDLQFYSRETGVSGLFVNRNHQGVLLAIIIPLLAVLTFDKELGNGSSAFRYGLFLLACLILLLLVLITGSRAGIFSYGFSISLTFLFGLVSEVPRAESLWLRRAPLFVVVLLALILTAVGLAESRALSLSRLIEQGQDMRWPVWGSMKSAIETYMPWGSGIGSYAEAYQVVEPDYLLRPTYSNHAHNEVLEVLMTAGLPGGALILLLSSYVFFVSRSVLKAPARQTLYGRLGCVILFVLACASLVDYPLRTPIMMSLFTIALVWTSTPRMFRVGAGSRKVCS